jgi:hypothetical protein
VYVLILGPAFDMTGEKEGSLFHQMESARDKLLPAGFI